MSSRWFHSKINAAKAEEVLLSTGTDGSFLVRASESKKGNFTISARHGGQVTHIKIENDGDLYCLAGSPDPFATLVELVQHYMNTPNSIKEKSGRYIDLLDPIRSMDPTTERWYHGLVNSVEAERLLLTKGKGGSYLVRESQSQPGQYVLAVRCRNGVQQIIINHHNEKFEIATGPTFNTLLELVEYYVENPKLHDIKDGSPIKLREPFQSTSFVASSIAERIKVLEKESGNGLTGFTEEFQQLQRFDNNDGAYSMNAGKLECNKWKNRYKNILPYDHSRVRLKGGDSKTPGHDYINANYITAVLKSWNIKYIAAQGCLQATTADFWSMVYQHNSSIIVMLANEVENGKSKCAKYWPDLGLTFEFQKIVVDNMLEHKTKHFIMRELRIYHTDKAKKAPHMVYQYHFTGWPDHGVPDDAGAVLGLISEIHTKHSSCGRNAPIIVHCSAGIGRTGTVIVIDLLMHLLDEQGLHAEVDIQKTSKIMRTERSGVIQTEVQYRFVYQSIKHYIETEGKRMEVKKDSQQRPAYGNIDFSKRREGKENLANRSAIPSKAVPRPPAASVHEKTTDVSPYRANATRTRMHTAPATSHGSKRPVPNPRSDPT